MKRNEVILPIARSSDLRGTGVFAEKALFSGENQVLEKERRELTEEEDGGNGVGMTVRGRVSEVGEAWEMEEEREM